MVKIERLSQRLSSVLKRVSGVQAAVLFGSVLEAPELARDVDVLLVIEERDIEETLNEIERRLLSSFPEVSLEVFDLVPFLPGPVDPDVLYEAMSKGRLLFNRNGAYERALERLSAYFIENEIILKGRELDYYGLEPQVHPR